MAGYVVALMVIPLVTLILARFMFRNAKSYKEQSSFSFGYNAQKLSQTSSIFFGLGSFTILVGMVVFFIILGQFLS